MYPTHRNLATKKFVWKRFFRLGQHPAGLLDTSPDPLYMDRPLLAPGGAGRNDHKEILMKTFETLLLLSPELAAEARETLLANLAGVLEREQGRIILADHWGMRDLAYPVRKQMRGYYVRLEYAAPGTAVAELERNIRIADGIFKFMTVQLGDHPEEENA
jgi:small subunit ribosomal protein S6